MNQKMIGTLVGLVIVVVIVIGVYFLTQNKTNTSSNGNPIQEEENNKSQEATGNSSEGSNKILVVYYSATSNTKSVAEKIANNLNADIFEIVPVEEYTSEDLNYNNPDSRVSREHNDESLRVTELKNTQVENWENYDTVLIGYPIWWGIAAWPIDTFVKTNDFNGKTVIPFCTSVSSGLGQSGELLKEKANGGNWKEGYRFRSNPSDSEIENFINIVE